MSARILLIDNYDSFTYNLVQAFLVLGAEVEVRRNDETDVESAAGLRPSHPPAASVAYVNGAFRVQAGDSGPWIVRLSHKSSVPAIVSSD